MSLSAKTCPWRSCSANRRAAPFAVMDAPGAKLQPIGPAGGAPSAGPPSRTDSRAHMATGLQALSLRNIFFLLATSSGALTLMASRSLSATCDTQVLNGLHVSICALRTHTLSISYG
eukprot:15462179-Alexandrium_andersonii.AAC.4